MSADSTSVAEIPGPLSSGSQGVRRRMASKAGAALVSQAITAGGSLVLQVLASRKLGHTGFGAFATCLALLVTATALYTGFVGDTLTVLDRTQRDIRSALSLCAMTLLAVSGVGAFGLVSLLHFGNGSLAITYGLMVVLWLIEETGRRILMARMQFWALVANDATYMVVTLAVIAAAQVSGWHYTLTMIVGAMAIGAAAAILLAVCQLPRSEWSGLRPRRAGVRLVCSFAIWRSGQAALRPAALLLSKVFLRSFVSLAAVGLVENGRLVVAPIQTVINGAGSFLLSTSAEAERDPQDRRRRLAERATVLLVGVTVLGGAAAAALASPLGRVMTKQAVSPWLVLGWSLYLATWAASLPFVTECVARKLTRQVFIIRLADSVLGMAALLAGLGLGAPASATPWLMSAGGVITAFWIRRLAVRSRPSISAVSAGIVE